LVLGLGREKDKANNIRSTEELFKTNLKVNTEDKALNNTNNWRG
jgi:hypothetical protein